MAGVHRVSKRGNGAGRRKRGAHRAKPARQPYAWLGAGAVALGMGMAMAGGTAVAHAEDTDSAGSTAAASSDSPSGSGSTSSGDASNMSDRETDDTEPSGAESDSESDRSAGTEDGSDDNTALESESEVAENEVAENEVVETEVLDSQDGAVSLTTVSTSNDEPTADTSGEEPAPESVSVTTAELESTTAALDEDGPPAEVTAADPEVAESLVATVPVADVTITARTTADLTAADAPAPITVNSIVTDVLTWIGLGPLASNLTIPALPVPSFVEALWLAIRQNMYAWNNQRPVATTSISGQDPVTGVITGKINAVDYEGDPITYIVTTNAAHGTVVIDAQGNFTYTPDPAYALAGGTDSFVVTVDDRIDNPPHTYGILGALGILGPTTTALSLAVLPVLPGNRSPRPGTPPFGYTVNTTTGEVTGTLDVTDPDGDDLSFVLGSAIDPAKGTLVVDEETGAWKYTPSAAARLEAHITTGVDTLPFSITVSDGEQSIAISITAPITELVPANQPPVIGTPAYEYTVNSTTGVVSGTVNVTDPDGDQLTYTATPINPALGTLVVNAQTGGWTYAPSSQAQFDAWKSAAPDTLGFTIVASDGVDTVDVMVSAPITQAAEFDILAIRSLGGSPVYLGVAPDGRKYVSNGSAIVALNPDGTTTTVPYQGRFLSGLAVGPDGKIYVTDAAEGTVSMLDPENSFSSALLATVSVPGVVAVGGDGRVYVGSMTVVPGGIIKTGIVVLDAEGNVVRTMDTDAVPGSLAVGPDGRVYMSVVNQATPNRIIIFNADGSSETIQFGTQLPAAVAVGPDGDLYVTEGSQGKLLVIHPDGSRDHHALPLGSHLGITADGQGRVYVTDAYSGALIELGWRPVQNDPPAVVGSGSTVLYVDPETGAVTGSVRVYDPEGRPLSYRLDTTVDPQVGTLTVSEATGIWTYAPTQAAREAAYDTTGLDTLPFRVIASDGTSSVLVDIAAPIIELAPEPPNQAPEVAAQAFGYHSIDEKTGIVKGWVDVADPDNDPLTFSLVGYLDPGIGSAVVDPETGSWTFTPTQQARLDTSSATGERTATFTVAVTDGQFERLVAVIAPITEPYVPPNHAPETWDPPVGYSVDRVSGVVSGQVNAHDPDGDILVYSLETDLDPAVGSVVIDSATGGWTYIPSIAARDAAYGATSGGAVSFLIIVSDGGSQISVQTTVLNADLAYPAGTVRINTSSGDVAIKAADTTTAYDWLGFDAVTGSYGLSNDDVSGWQTAWVSGSPLGELSSGKPVYHGGSVKIDPWSPSVAVRADPANTAGEWFVFDPSHGGYFVSGNEIDYWLDVHVAPPPPNEAPRIGEPAYAFTVDRTTGEVRGNIVATDPEGGALFFELAVPLDPASGNLTVDAGTGDWTFTPGEQLRHEAWTTPGGDSFAFEVLVSDGEATVPVSITAPVSPLDPSPTNYAPIVDAVATSHEVDPDSGVVTGYVNVYDIDGDQLTFSVSEQLDPALGVLTLSTSTGAWVYRPNTQTLIRAWASGQPLVADFEIAVSDGQSETMISVRAPVGVSDAALGHILARMGSQPSGVAVTPDGTVFITNAGANTVTRINNDGTSTSFDVGRNPVAMAVSADGILWVANADDDTLSMIWGNGVQRVVRVGGSPVGLAVGADGFVYVANSGEGTVSVVSPDGRWVQHTANIGGTPRGITLGGDGLIYVTDLAGDRITVIDPVDEYSIIDIDGVGGSPYGIAVDIDGTIYVSNPFVDTVTILQPRTDGSYDRSTVAVGDSPSDVRILSDGRVYVANTGSGTVSVIDPTTQATVTLTAGDSPIGVAMTPDGTLLVVNAESNSLTRFDADGNDLGDIDVAQQVSQITIGSNGQLIVVNRYSGLMTVISARPGSAPGYAVTTQDVYGGVSGQSMALSPDGTLYFAWNGWFDTILAAYDSAGQQFSDVRISNFIGSPGPMAVMKDGRVLILINGNLHVATLTDSQDRHSEWVDLGDMPFRLTNLAVSADGRINLFTSNNSVLVLNPDFSPVATISPWGDPGWSMSPGKILADKQGRVFLTNPMGDLVVINPDHSVDTVPGVVSGGGFSIGRDGKIYLPDYTNKTVIVLNPDYSRAAVVAVGNEFFDTTVAPDGRILLFGGRDSIGVLDPTDYTLSTVHVGGSMAHAVANDDTVYLYKINGFNVNGGALGEIVRITLPVVGPPVDPGPPTDPEEPEPPTSWGPAPSTVDALYDRLRDRTTDYNDGIYIETVRDGEGTTRLIVYIGGTDPTSGSNQAIWENLTAGIGLLKDDQTDLIDGALANCGDCAEIMLVGYSQGGLDALNIANDVRYRDKVSTVITYGTPIMRTAGQGDAVLHIQDEMDVIAHLPDIMLRAVPGPFGFVSSFLYRGIVTTGGELYQGYAGVVWDAHGDRKTYATLGQRFEMNRDAKYSRVRESIDRFEGAVVDRTAWEDTNEF